MSEAAPRLGRVTVEPDGPAAGTIVLLHGFGGQATQWLSLMRKLAKEGFACIALDLPGHAGSLAYPGAGPAKVAAKAVAAELRTIGPAYLVGHSKGGAVASLVALFEPSLVTGLTLLAPGGFGPEINAAVLREYGRADKRTDMWRLMPHFYAPGFRIPLASMDRAAGMRARKGQKEMLTAMAHIITNDDGTQGTLPLDTIAGLGKRIEVLWGEEDDIIPVAQAEALAAGFDVTIFRGVGHQLHEEVPDLVAAHVALGARIGLGPVQ